MVFNTDYSLMQVKSIAKYFRPSLSYQFSLRSLFCLFLKGRFIHFTVSACLIIFADLSESLLLNDVICIGISYLGTYNNASCIIVLKQYRIERQFCAGNV